MVRIRGKVMDEVRVWDEVRIRAEVRVRGEGKIRVRALVRGEVHLLLSSVFFSVSFVSFVRIPIL